MQDSEKTSKETNTINAGINRLIKERIPWLFLGLLVGMISTLIVSKFETILSSDIRLTFFIPIIVYLSDAVGTQTETIYIRALSQSTEIKKEFRKYLLKETATGLGLGIIFGFLFGIFAFYWLNSYNIGLAIGITILINLTFSPLLALVIPRIIYKKHSDPALGSGPVATIIQDIISLIIYFLIASIFVF